MSDFFRDLIELLSLDIVILEDLSNSSFKALQLVLMSNFLSTLCKHCLAWIHDCLNFGDTLLAFFLFLHFVELTLKKSLCHVHIESRKSSFLTCTLILVMFELFSSKNCLILDLCLLEVGVQILYCFLEPSQSLGLEVATVHKRLHVVVSELLLLFLGCAYLVCMLLYQCLERTFLVNVLSKLSACEQGSLLRLNDSLILWVDTHGQR